MIISIGGKDTEFIWNGWISKNLPIVVQEVARRKCRMINNATNITDLMIPKSNGFEKLNGSLKAYHSIKISHQYRIIFKWIYYHAYELEIIDYH